MSIKNAVFHFFAKLLAILSFPFWGINYRSIFRYLLFILLLPFVLIGGVLIRILVHPKDRT